VPRSPRALVRDRAASGQLSPLRCGAAMRHTWPRMPPTARTLALIALTTLSGCGHGTAARQALEHGNYLQAERVADQALREHPDDGEARSLRQQAREKSLGKLLEDVRAARARGDGEGALVALGQLLERRRAWDVRLPGDGEAAVAAEVDRAG